MAAIHNPSHPGLILREDVLPALGLTVTEAAGQLGVSRVALSRVVNGRASISAEMALRLAKWLGNGPEVWLRMQVAHDLWRTKKGAAQSLARIKKVSVSRHAKTKLKEPIFPA